MTDQSGSHRPAEGPQPSSGPRWPADGHTMPEPPEGPPPVYVGPALSTPVIATGEVEMPSRAARNRRRRNRKRGLLRLGVVAAIVVAAIIVAVVLATRGDTPGAPAEEHVDPILFTQEIARVAGRYDLDPFLIAAVAKTESGYRAEVVSPAGAVGLMQLMPDTADWVTGLESWEGDPAPVLTDPADSLELGACYLRYLMDEFDEHTQIALAAYNAGQGTVGDWLAAAGGVEGFDLTDIVYPETQEFVRRVEHYRELYTRVYPDAFSGTGGST